MRGAANLGVATVVAAMIVGCGPRAERAAVAEPARAEILFPADGDSVSLPVTIRLAAHGVTIAPATGAREEGIGHHHLILNADPTPAGEPIPSTEQHIHLGTGVGERVFDALPPGIHRIIAILAWGDHVPITGAVTDTIRIVVR